MKGSETIRLAVLGAGGLGKAAARISGMKKELRLVAICDSRGVVASADGIDGSLISGITGDLVTGYRKISSRATSRSASVPAGKFALEEGDGGSGFSQRVGRVDDVPAQTVSESDVKAWHCEDPLGEVIALRETYDAVLVALPNLPNAFIPNVIKRFVESDASLAFVDVLKRTAAVEQMLALGPLVEASRNVVMTGCGATPGILAAAAVLAAQSFIKIEKVDIWWGVGIANWDSYKATIREDIAHLPGYTVERAKAMTDEEVEALLEKTQGLLELRGMEHADDILLQRVGVVDSLGQVEVGGVMDTRHPKKPVSTTMTLTGITFEGKRSSHKFILGDETTMAANVIGPAFGYLKRALWLKRHGLFGVFGCTEFLPMVAR